MSGYSCRAAVCSERDGRTRPTGERRYYQVSHTELRRRIRGSRLLDRRQYH